MKERMKERKNKRRREWKGNRVSEEENRSDKTVDENANWRREAEKARKARKGRRKWELRQNGKNKSQGKQGRMHLFGKS